MFSDKRVRAVWRKKLFCALAFLCFATVLTGVEGPHLYQAVFGPTRESLWLLALAMSLTVVGMLAMASSYGRADVEIERLKLERQANE
jgi:hypothetical protein